MSGSDGGRRRVIRWRKSLVQRRVSIRTDHLRPQRWNWYGLLIPLAPLAWALITAPWQVGIINTFSGFLWAGYNLASFNLLLALAPDEQRPRAVALYQTAVFGSVVIGPVLGSFMADVAGFKVIFELSSVGRYLGTALFILFTIRPIRALKV